MDTVRGVALAVAAVTIAVGLVAVVGLELRHPQRRLVGRVRDAVEVLAPPLLTAALLALVWAAA